MGELQLVDVLLGLYEPDEKLFELLDSVQNQSSVRVQLIVSWDSHTDIRIQERISGMFNQVIFLSGPNQGPCANYLHMLKYSKSEFVAFCDQDDIWKPFHLERSISRLSTSALNPAMSYSACLEFGKGPERIWPQQVIPRITSYIFENPARGCTIVMNSAGREILVDFPTAKVLMHDWLALLAIQLSGEVLFGAVPEVEYRLHSKNTIGRPRRFTPGKMITKLKSVENSAIEQYLWIYGELEKRGSVQDELGIILAKDFKMKKFSRIALSSRLRLNKIEDPIFKIYLIYQLAIRNLRIFLHK